MTASVYGVVAGCSLVLSIYYLVQFVQGMQEQTTPDYHHNLISDSL